MSTVLVNGYDLPVREFQCQRVVTFRDIDSVHSRPDGTAGRNFRENREHFIEGIDYFQRNSSEAKSEFGIIAPNGLTLITESGYLMLVKSFTDDLAWKVQRQLVNGYFRAQLAQSIRPEHAAGVASLIRATVGPLEKKKANPLDCCQQAKLVMDQCGVAAIPNYTEPNLWENQQTMLTSAPTMLIGHVDNLAVGTPLDKNGG